ncbi:hypothetical protein GCM10025876_32110 [Demequina litorisediminis]|uniref:Uncharacterized protein n=1 Tax=Demequina litorisediminis TaxID=1849022 RepID=A0ABQ6IIL9_9MICO|nr:hypothetical protein GCM10025876_32110 [Demequina litorisediminis]
MGYHRDCAKSARLVLAQRATVVQQDQVEIGPRPRIGAAQRTDRAKRDAFVRSRGVGPVGHECLAHERREAPPAFRAGGSCGEHLRRCIGPQTLEVPHPGRVRDLSVGALSSAGVVLHVCAVTP